MSRIGFGVLDAIVSASGTDVRLKHENVVESHSEYFGLTYCWYLLAVDFDVKPGSKSLGAGGK